MCRFTTHLLSTISIILLYCNLSKSIWNMCNGWQSDKFINVDIYCFVNLTSNPGKVSVKEATILSSVFNQDHTNCRYFSWSSFIVIIIDNINHFHVDGRLQSRNFQLFSQNFSKFNFSLPNLKSARKCIQMSTNKPSTDLLYFKTTTLILIEYFQIANLCT